MQIPKPSTQRLEQVVNSFLTAKEKVLYMFNTAGLIDSNWTQIVSIPEVRFALTEQQSYRDDALQLANRVSKAALDKFKEGPKVAKTPFAITYAWKVEAVCDSHKSPVTVAHASIDAPIAASEEHVREQLKSMSLTHGHLTSSLHSETIENGRVYHTKCGSEAKLSLVGRIMRLIPVEDAEAKTDGIIEDTMRLDPLRRQNGNPLRHAKVAVRLETELAYLARAQGEDRIYTSLYEALRQTRHRAITLPHIAKNVPLERSRLQLLWPLLGNAVEPELSRDEVAFRLTNNPFIQALEQIVARHIANPYVVVTMRMKGESLGDKYLLMEHYDALKAATESGALRRYFKAMDVPLPAWLKIWNDGSREKPHFDMPNPHDHAAITVITHGDAVTYDHTHIASQFASGALELPPEGEITAIENLHQLFYWIGNVPVDRRGYLKKDGSANFKSPKYRELGEHNSKFGFRVYLTEEGTMDRTINGTSTGYKALWVLAKDDHTDAIAELQFKTNLMDNIAETDPNQSHDLRKLQQRTMIDFLIEKGTCSRAEVYLARRLATAYESQQERNNGHSQANLLTSHASPLARS